MAVRIVVIILLVSDLAKCIQENQTLCGADNPFSKFGQLIYDVTSSLETNQQAEYFCNHDWNTTGYHVCSHGFYRMEENDIGYRTVIEAIGNYFETQYSSSETISSIGFIFGTDDTCQFQQYLLSPSTVISRYYPAALVATMHYNSNSDDTCIGFCFLVSPYQYPDVPGSPGPNRLRRGWELDEKLFACLLHSCNNGFSYWDVTILNLEISTFSDMSFTAFSRKVENILDEAIPILSSYNNNFEFYLRITLSPQAGDELENTADMYAAYIAIYADGMKSDRRAQFILNTVKESTIKQANSTAKWIRNNVYPYISPESLHTPCKLPKLLTVSGSTFEYVALETKGLQPNITSTSVCSHNTNENNALVTSPSKLVIWLDSPSTGYDFLELIRHNATDIRIDTLYVENILDPSQPADMATLHELATSLNVSLVCSQTIQPDVNGNCNDQGLDLSCDPSFTMKPVVFINWRGNQYTAFYDYDKMMTMLERSLKCRRDILKKISDVDVHLQLNIQDKFAHGLNLFCAPYLSSIKDVQDIVIIWAHIHNFPINMQPLIDESENSGFWYELITETDLNNTASDFYLLIRRNIPQMPNDMTLFPSTHPCIHWTSHLFSSDASKATMRTYSGITIDLIFLDGERKLTVEELQMLLVLAFQRFDSVDITSITNQFEVITAALAGNLKTALNSRIVETGNLELYIEFSDLNILQDNWSKITRTDFRVTGFHYARWEDDDDQTKTEITDFVEKHFPIDQPQKGIVFGLTVQNCSKQINSKLRGFTSLPYLKFVRYVICVLKPIRPTNENQTEFQIYLDTQFYIQQYFQLKLGVDTYFRASFSPKGTDADPAKTENYLRFFNDTKQYSEGYKIKQFLGDGFSNVHDNIWSWYVVSGSADLTNISNFKELESDYYGLETELRYKIPPLSYDSVNINISWIVGLSVGLLLSFAGLSCLVVYIRRLKRRILTKREVDEFRHGEVISRNVDSEEGPFIQSSTVTSKGFNPQFEIPKKNITLVDQIGRGNFAMVYTGFLKDHGEVAVKVPSGDCSKENFKKSMLTEARILSYIGSHQNVLSFIGAYTKAIHLGMIFIVTEYCERGPLLKYLRARKPQPLAASDDDEEIPSHYQMVRVNLQELYRFAYEIASGMEYVASMKVVHSDLSARNVFLNQYLICKIGDFGLSGKLYESTECSKSDDEHLPWRWMAPESMQELKFTTKSDVWSFGVTLWEIFTFGDVPYPGIAYDPDFPL